MAHIEAGWPEGTELGPEPPAGEHASGAMLSWLVRGTHRVAVDQRRRFGRHSQSRRLLAADGAVAATMRGTWQDLVAALHRQAVHSALAKLRKADRQILTLAYLQGHTNREIAAMLGVSIRTVSRRLSAALARLDDYVREARIWVAALAILGLAHLRGARWPGISTATAATVAVVALGAVAIGPEPPQSRLSTPPPAVTQSIGVVPHAPVVAPVVGLPSTASPAEAVELSPSPVADTAVTTDRGKHRGWSHGHHPHGV